MQRNKSTTSIDVLAKNLINAKSAMNKNTTNNSPSSNTTNAVHRNRKGNAQSNQSSLYLPFNSFFYTFLSLYIFKSISVH
jgi:hypothetical protein